MENQEPRKFKLRRLVPIHTQRHEDTNGFNFISLQFLKLFCPTRKVTVELPVFLMDYFKSYYLFLPLCSNCTAVKDV
ncbi:uncharacterized protein [Leptinotarsa decemlineata]|uniref:uncharacterized protein n=1 Tax=Leptinotarsa decemlineata TaxID=7539 RepID=UPI003D3061EA